MSESLTTDPKNESELWQILLAHAESSLRNSQNLILVKSLYALNKVDEPPDQDFLDAEEALFEEVKKLGDEFFWRPVIGACRILTILRRRFLSMEKAGRAAARKEGLHYLNWLRSKSVTFESEQEVDDLIGRIEESLSWGGLKLDDIITPTELEILRKARKREVRRSLNKPRRKAQ